MRTDNIPTLMNGDLARVMQIFTNLLGNGIKFTQAGRIIVRGWVDETEPGEGATLHDPSKIGEDQVVMMFEVDDTGIGIDRGGAFILRSLNVVIRSNFWFSHKFSNSQSICS